MYEKLKEIAKSKGKQLFIESCSVSKSNINEIKEFSNKAKLIESKGEQFEALAVLEGVEVTIFSPNENGRLYPKKLWEKVIKEGVAEGSKCYANHAEESQDVRNICGVWHNFRIDEVKQKGVADLYLIGQYGKLFLEAVKAGSAGEGLSTHPMPYPFVSGPRRREADLLQPPRLDRVSSVPQDSK